MHQRKSIFFIFRFAERPDMFKAKDVMKTKLVIVTEDTPIYEAVQLLVDNNVTGLPVVQDDMTLVGILSEKDVLRLLYNLADRSGKVGQFMATNIVTFKEDDSLIDVCDCLISNSFRRVPIVRDGKLVGIVSRKDIIGCFRIRRAERDPNPGRRKADRGEGAGSNFGAKPASTGKVSPRRRAAAKARVKIA